VQAFLPATGRDNSFDFYFEQHNHSKRSVGVDLGTDEGREILLRLVAEADVFVTSFLEQARQRWRITYEDLKARNTGLIYARTHGWGPKGPEATDPGYDALAYWARSGLGYMAAVKGDRARPMPTGGFGDSQAGAMLAGGVAAALFHREKTGEGTIVDVSLYGMGVWAMWESIHAAATFDIDAKDFRPENKAPVNPLAASYVTRDNRDILLFMMEADKFWPGLCAAFELHDLEDDPRFRSFEARAENRDVLTQVLSDFIASHDLADLERRLDGSGCIYALYATPSEVAIDEQAWANNYFLAHPSVPDRFLVSSPVQFGAQPVELRAGAPVPGQHTEEVLLELGYDWGQIGALKGNGVIT
jgi:crotonobetainyl-CoA:carnitine CoA-transferase CaiB-like acyl-CoA transferase